MEPQPGQHDQPHAGASPKSHAAVPAIKPEPTDASNHEHNGPSNNSCFILRLSSELLIEVLSYIIDARTRPSGRRYAQLCAIALTCRRFNLIATPFLYKSIDLKHRKKSGKNVLVPPCSDFITFHRTMAENPSLRSLCKSLTFRIAIMPRTSKARGRYAMADELLPWLAELRSLVIHGGFELNDTWVMVRDAVRQLPKLQSIAFSGSKNGLKLHDFQQCMGLSTLRDVALLNVAPHRDASDGDFVLPQVNQRTACFKKLRLTDMNDTPESLKAFVSWAVELEHFECTLTDPMSKVWTFKTYDSILATHASTLTTLALGYGSLWRGETEIIDLTKYPNLEVLRISAFHIHCSPEIASRGLASPRLRKFVMDFTLPVAYELRWIPFTREEANWITKFASLHSAEFSNLRTIEIDFPLYPPPMSLTVEIEFPWDIMEETKKAIEPIGFDLLYDPPVYSKTHFFRKLKGPPIKPLKFASLNLPL